MTQIVRLPGGLALLEDGQLRARLSHHSIAELLRLSAADLRGLLEAAGDSSQAVSATILAPLAPIDGLTEVWAAGVTYRRSEEARVEESGTPDIYTRVYSADRPELFFKANARRVAGPGEPVVVRTDSTWDVPEPELAVVVNAAAEIVGYTIGNDVSSRSIEGDNPLYLPQAKVYQRSCALGPGITPAWQIADPYALGIRMHIVRNGQLCWSGEATTSDLKRRLEDLIEHLFREDHFPDGVILSTGTPLVPDSPFTLQDGDVVDIAIDRLGALRNPVVRGKTAL
ncbi:MAG TPA: fumarylacetoacetate hydrolase family protein [Chloroflexota bacterium]|nr:fumarylacetoacetate hydrolase family protein [Chloroflexota bacterium]